VTFSDKAIRPHVPLSPLNAPAATGKSGPSAYEIPAGLFEETSDFGQGQATRQVRRKLHPQIRRHLFRGFALMRAALTAWRILQARRRYFWCGLDEAPVNPPVCGAPNGRDAK
jgi:hypothetical protein